MVPGHQPDQVSVCTSSVHDYCIVVVVGVFFIIKANGNLEVWDLMDR